MSKYSYNKSYFEKIDTKDKAYWLGFIAADGCIINNGITLEIGLSSINRNHLVKFIHAINGTEEMIKDRLSYKNGIAYEVSRVRICCKQLCNDLAKYGILPCKSYNVCFPKFLDDNLIPDYLRGYFDGDGSISTNGKNRNGSPKWALNLIATEEFLNDFMNYLEPLNISKIKLQSKSGMRVWNKVGINQITIILNLLYKNSDTYLERKYTKYLNICPPKLNSH